MLVLSRKKKERVLFPNLGISIQMLRINGNVVQVGIDAPREVKVLRGELAEGLTTGQAREQIALRRHAFRNRLNTANLLLSLLQQQIARGQFDEAARNIDRLIDELTGLENFDGGATVPAAAAPDGNRQPATAAAADRRRALLVDDDANERELLAGLLRMHGFEVDVVADGLQAMTYLAENARPDVVLLDMQMPRMDGRKTLSAIRCNPELRDLKVYAVSGVEERSPDVHRARSGVDRWFSKPLNPARLVDHLDREIQRTDCRAEGLIRCQQ